MKRQSLLIKTLLAFVILLIMHQFISAFLFDSYLMKYIHEEISNSNISKLKIVKNTNKMLLEDIKKNALKVSLNQTIEDISGINNYDELFKEINDVLKISYAQDVIVEMVRTNPNLHSVYMYPYDADYILTTNNGVLPLKQFADQESLDVYYKYREGKQNKMWMNSRLLPGEQSKKTHVISYIYPLTIYTTSLQGALIINVDENLLSNQINDGNYEYEGYIRIINGNGDVISDIDKSLIGSNIKGMPFVHEIIESDSKEGYLTTIINDQAHIVSYYKTDLNNWIYLGILPTKVLKDRMFDLRIKVIFSLLGIIFIGAVIAYFFARKLYSPVYELVKDIKLNNRLYFHRNENEIDILSRAFDSLVKNEKRIKAELEKNQLSVEQNYYINLIKGNPIQPWENKMILPIFTGNSFISAVILIDRYREFCARYPIKQQYYLKTLILNICDEVLHGSIGCKGVILEHEKMAVIINMTENQKREHIVEQFQQIQREVSNIIDYSVTIGVGELHKGISGIHDSYTEAQSACKRKLLEGKGKIIFYSDYNYNRNVYYYPYIEEKHIINSLTLGNRDEMESAVINLVHKVRTEKNISIENVIQIFNQLMGNTIKYLVENNIQINKVLENDFNIYLELHQLETIDDIESWLLNMYESLIDNYIKIKNENIKYMTKMKDYIQKNYRKDISINMLADQVGLSYSYIRKLFKDTTGKNIVDYVNSIRIEEAKNLLVQTDMTMIEIALGLGYNNDQSFYRYFKKYEGITPGEYKRTNHQ